MSSNTVTNKKKMKIGMLMIFFMQVSILDNHLSLLSKKKIWITIMLHYCLEAWQQECLRDGILSKALKSKPVLPFIKFVLIFGLKCAKKIVDYT